MNHAAAQVLANDGRAGIAASHPLFHPEPPLRRLALAALLAASALPALAAEKPIAFGAEYAPYLLTVVLHFPEGAGREREGRCTEAQREQFRRYFAGYLDSAKDRLVADYEAANGVATRRTTLATDFQVGCHPDGGLTITRYTPDQPVPTLHYDPATGRWDIVG